MTIRFLLLALGLGATLAATAAPLTGADQAAHVLNRLAFGPRPGDVERVQAMGVPAYIDEQLNPERIALPSQLVSTLADLEAANAPAGVMVARYRDAIRAGKDGDAAARADKRRAAYEIEAAHVLRAIASPRQLEEVMVDFWFNHFNVYRDKGLDRALVASYERDAIRPHVFGRFRDLLGATARHPAMLFYLDNHLSTAADFRPRRPGNGPAPHGLNENYARELMELHTLGVDGGYTQRDVTELARMLTGWTFRPTDLAGLDDGFRFDARRHDRGTKQWLGRTVPGRGQQEGEFALDVLAMHPATARHVSRQLAQYFVRDDPPPELVERMAQAWLGSDGSIRTVLRVLFTSPEFMDASARGAKFKTPFQYVVSAVRAAGTPVRSAAPLLRTLEQLGMPVYGCQTPDGYKNTEQAWLNPDALQRRIGFATALASGRLALDAVPPQLGGPARGGAAAGPALDQEALLATLGPLVSPAARATIAASARPLRAALVLGSPDFMQH